MKKTNPIKEELKKLAQQIRESKVNLKDKQRKGTASYKDHWSVSTLKSQFRHRHIAYCLVKGKLYEQIERPRLGNEPDAKSIEFHMNEIKQILEKYYAPKEDVCSSSTGS